MDFNIYAKTLPLFGKGIWYLSGTPPPPIIADRLELAYLESYSMLNSDSPILLTLMEGRCPVFGQIAKGVFFCDPHDFEFGGYLLANTPFWSECIGDKSLIDSLIYIGNLLEGNCKLLTAQLYEWERMNGLYCFNVFL